MKKLLCLFLILTFYIPADERAGSGKCYLAIGFAENQNQIKTFLSDKSFPLESYEAFRRKDGKVYFTLGKMDEKLFKNLEKSGKTNGLFCTSGKGFEKRFNVNSDYQLKAGTKKFIDSESDFFKIINLTQSDSQDSAEESKQDKSLKLTPQDAIPTKKDNPIVIAKTQRKVNPSISKLIEDYTAVTTSLENITKFSGFFSFYSKSNYLQHSFDWILVRNKSFKGYTPNLDGGYKVDSNVLSKILIIKPGLNFYNDGQKFVYQNDLDADRNLESLIKFLWSTNYIQDAYNDAGTLLTEIAKNELASNPLFKDIKYEFAYWGNNVEWIMQPKQFHSYGQFNTCQNIFNFSDSLSDFAYIFMPKSCLYYHEGTQELKQISYQNFLPDIEKAYTFNFFNFVNDSWNAKFVEPSLSLAELSGDENNTGHFLLTFDEGNNLCTVTGSSSIANRSALISKVTDKKHELSSILAKHTAYQTQNDLYSAIYSKQCKYVIVELDEFFEIQAKEKKLDTNFFNFSITNLENFQSNDQAQEVFSKLFNNLTISQVDNYASTTGEVITPSNIKQVQSIEVKLNELGLPFNNEQSKRIKNLALSVTSGGSPIFNMNALLEMAIYFKNQFQIDLLDQVNLENEFKAIIGLSGFETLAKHGLRQPFSLYFEILKESNDLEIAKQSAKEINHMMLSGIAKTNTKLFYFPKIMEARNEYKNAAAQKNVSFISFIDELKSSEDLQRQEMAEAKRKREEAERKEFLKNYPYKVVVECHLGGSRTILYACFGGIDQAETEIKITSGGNGYSYGYYDLAQSGMNFLSEDVKQTFSIRAQLSEGGPFSLKLFVRSNVSNQTLLTDSCSQSYCVVQAANYNIN